MDGIERFFHSAETFTAQVLDPVAGNTALTGESQSLLTTPELQTFLGTTWAKARLYEGWDDTARLGLWVAWLIRLLIERHVKSGVYAEDALVGLLMAYGLYAERILTNRIVADRPKLNELADRFKNRQWAVAALAAAGLHACANSILRSAAEAGLETGTLTIDPALWPQIVRPFGYDAGIRTLNRTISGITNKVARQIIEGQVKTIHITPDNIKQFLPKW